MFVQIRTEAAGIEFPSMVAGDFNEDGYLDIVLSSYSVTFSMLQESSNATLQRVVSLSSQKVGSAIVLGVSDLNEDHHFDIIVHDPYDGVTSAMFGYGNGTFWNEILVTYPYTDLDIYLVPFVVGDFNVDGHLDLARVDMDYCFLYASLGYGNGTFEVVHKLSIGNGSCMISVTVDQFNIDSHLDISFINERLSEVTFLLGYGNGTFRTVMKLSTGDYGFPCSIIAKDFNNDGYSDIAVSKIGNSNVGVFMAIGDGTFEEQKSLSIGLDTEPILAESADLNSDGCLDLVVLDRKFQNICVLPGYSNGTFSTQIKFPTEHD